NGFTDELTFGLGRRRSERGPWHPVGPHRFDDRLEDWQRNTATSPSPAAAQRAALVAGIVVANPHRDGDFVGKPYEPSVILVVGGAGFARNVGREAGDRARRAARNNTLHHALELKESRTINGRDRDGCGFVTIDGCSVALDAFNHIGNRAY